MKKTEWHRVAVFGKPAEILGEYACKGTQVYIEGKLQTRKWKDQSGQDRYTTETVVQGFGAVMQLLGGKRIGKPQQGGWGQPQQPQQQQPQYNEPPMDFDDDIPQ